MEVFDKYNIGLQVYFVFLIIFLITFSLDSLEEYSI